MDILSCRLEPTQGTRSTTKAVPFTAHRCRNLQHTKCAPIHHCERSTPRSHRFCTAHSRGKSLHAASDVHKKEKADEHRDCRMHLKPAQHRFAAFLSAISSKKKSHLHCSTAIETRLQRLLDMLVFGAVLLEKPAIRKTERLQEAQRSWRWP